MSSSEFAFAALPLEKKNRRPEQKPNRQQLNLGSGVQARPHAVPGEAPPHKTCIARQMNGACLRSFETGPESIIHGLNHATQSSTMS
jgi:hypothetical protein